MTVLLKMSQQRLFTFDNPLRERLGAKFFADLPKEPGVYFFKGALGELLYVGKAKNLRARLSSYVRARPENVSRKVIRMVHLIRSIEWQICASEKEALVLENELIRTRKPPFNVMNKYPETYYAILLTRHRKSLEFHLTTDPRLMTESSAPNQWIFGSFKGRGAVRHGYAALLRLLWAYQQKKDRFEYPSALNPARAAGIVYRFELGIEDEKLERLIRRFLAGTSRVLLDELVLRLLGKENIPKFFYHCIQEDLESLEAFYESGPHRNRRLKRHHGLPTHSLIAQESIDDLIVAMRLEATTGA